MNKIDIDTAVSHIKQGHRSDPGRYLFVVGAGISVPSVPLAPVIQARCETKARRLRRRVNSPMDSSMDRYSEWFKAAYPNAEERSRYIRSLIAGKPIPTACLRLAHLLQPGGLSKFVITTNFDDFIFRALTLFGQQPLVYDHPDTIRRVDPTRAEVQILHVHGGYQFYDSCNLKEEILPRASAGGGLSDVALLIRDLLRRRSALIVGYSGWEGDPIMAALKEHLIRGTPFNTYWFCHTIQALSGVPDWLKGLANVFFVVPAESADSGPFPFQSYPLDLRPPGRPFSEHAGTETVTPAIGDPVAGSVSEPGRTATPRAAQLTADTVLGRLVKALKLESPEVTRDPLGFFANYLRRELRSDRGAEAEDTYPLESILERAEAAVLTDRSLYARAVETNLLRVREKVRTSDYEEAITAGLPIRARDLDPTQNRTLMSLLLTAAERLADNSNLEESAYARIVALAQSLPVTTKADNALVIRAKVAAAHLMLRLGNVEAAIGGYTDALSRSGAIRERDAEEAIAGALLNLGAAYGNLGRHRREIATYDRLLRRFQSTREPAVRAQIARALFNKGVEFGRRGLHKDALKSYGQLHKRFFRSVDAEVLDVLGAGLINQGVTHGFLDQGVKEVGCYDEIVRLLGGNSEPSLQLLVAKGMLNKSLAGLRRGDMLGSVLDADEFLGRFSANPDSEVEEVLARVLISKGCGLAGAGDMRGSASCFREVVRRFGSSSSPRLSESVAVAHTIVANNLTDRRVAVRIYDRVIAQYGRSDDQGLTEQVGLARINRALALVNLGQEGEALSTLGRPKMALIQDVPPLYLASRAEATKATALIRIKKYKAGVGLLDGVLAREAAGEISLSVQDKTVALLNRGVALAKMKRFDDAEVDFDVVVKVLSGSKSGFAQHLLARALRFRAATLASTGDPDAAVSAYRSILAKYRSSEDLEERQSFDSALNGLAFASILRAKKLLGAGRVSDARKLLCRCRDQLAKLIARNPVRQVRAYAIGNQAYVAFLLGDPTAARQLIREAIRVGGESLRAAEIKDTRLYPVGLDREFRDLVGSVPSETPDSALRIELKSRLLPAKHNKKTATRR